MSSVIILDSSDEETDAIDSPQSDKQPTQTSTITKKNLPNSSPLHQDISIKENTINANVENQSLEHNGHSNIVCKRRPVNSLSPPSQPTKRIKPILISTTLSHKEFQADSPIKAADSEDENEIKSKEISEDTITEMTATTPETPEKEPFEENPITSTFSSLLEACKSADSSDDMETLIQKKLLKYYHAVHPDFVNSKGFSKTVQAVTGEIKLSPELVYYKVRTIVEELKIRRKSKSTVICNEEVTTTGNEHKDRQIKRLNKALYILKKRIAKLEEDEVDLGDEDNSTYLQVERYKKRACEIYEKICDLTGESKHAHRSVKKPINFQGTCYSQFNRTIQAFVNRTNTFPDFFDVLRCLEHCNKQYGFGLKTDEIKKIAQDAFLKIGKSLQSRRKTDLYETVSHFIGSEKDPALIDTDLSLKLLENQKFHGKIATIIDRFAAEQELSAEVQKEKQNAKDTTENISKEKESELDSNSVLILSTTTDCIQNSTEKSSSPIIVESNNASNDKDEELLNNEKPVGILKSVLSLLQKTIHKPVVEIIISDEEDS